MGRVSLRDAPTPFQNLFIELFLIEKMEVEGLGNDTLWKELNVALSGTVDVNLPRVSKKALIATVQTQLHLMENMTNEFLTMKNTMEKTVKEMESTRYAVEQLKKKTSGLERKAVESSEKIESLEEKIVVQGGQIKQLLEMEDAFGEAQEEIVDLQDQGVKATLAREMSEQRLTETSTTLQTSINTVHRSVSDLSGRMDNEQNELIISAKQVMVGDVNLATTLSLYDSSMATREKEIKESGDNLLQQSDNLQEMMVDTRQSLEHNTNIVEHVQRELLDKADRVKVVETIDQKYEEIISTLQHALGSINEDEVRTLPCSIFMLMIIL